MSGKFIAPNFYRIEHNRKLKPEKCCHGQTSKKTFPFILKRNRLWKKKK